MTIEVNKKVISNDNVADNIYGYIYLNTYPNKYFYIGQHKYNKPEIDPRYFGSSTFANLYRWKPCKREILCVCNSAEELNQAEREMIDLYLGRYGVAPCVRHHNPRMAEPYKDGIMLNEQMGGNVQVLSEATIEKIRQSKQEYAVNPDNQAEIEARNEKRKATCNTPEWKQAQSDRMKGVLVGDKNGFFGKHHTDVTKEKIRQSKQEYAVNPDNQAEIEARNEKRKATCNTPEWKQNMSKLKKEYNANPDNQVAIQASIAKMKATHNTPEYKQAQSERWQIFCDNVEAVAEWKRGISVGNKKWNADPANAEKKAEMARKRSESLKGVKNPRYGKPLTDVAKEKLRKVFSIPIYCIRLADGYEQTFESAKVAATVLNFDHSAIVKASKGIYTGNRKKPHVYKGYYWGIVEKVQLVDNLK